MASLPSVGFVLLQRDKDLYYACYNECKGVVQLRAKGLASQPAKRRELPIFFRFLVLPVKPRPVDIKWSKIDQNEISEQHGCTDCPVFCCFFLISMNMGSALCLEPTPQTEILER